MNESDTVADFLFETGILAKIPRSGFAFLGSGEQSVAEHTLRVAFVGYVLAQFEEDVDVEKLLKMCLFHDLPEARTSDFNNVSKRYAEIHEERAVRDLTLDLPFGDEIKALIEEFEAERTPEAVLARDADQLELVLALKRELDLGNRRAEAWLPHTIDRLRSDSARSLAEAILRADSDRWWWPYQDEDDSAT